MVYILIGYVILEILIGSILFCWIFSKQFKNVDIIKLSKDHNPGAFNAFDFAGAKVGMLGLIMDLLKGALPVYLFYKFFNSYCSTYWISLVMMAPVLGHALGIYNNFKGGKCITTSFGVLVGVLPLTYSVFFLAGLYIITCFFKTESYRVKSIITYVIMILISISLIVVTKEIYVHLGCILISIIAIVKHIVEKTDKTIAKSK